MAQRRAHTKKRSFTLLKLGVAALAVAVVGFGVFSFSTPAVASRSVDLTTIGIGDDVSTVSPDAVDQSASRLQTSDDQGVSDTRDASAARSINVEDPDPVVYISAVDTANPRAVEAAESIGTTDPLPTAPRVLPDVTGEGWQQGLASAYSFADNDDGHGNFGTSVTASGRHISDYGLTVAVPASESWRIGEPVAIVYGETVIITTVTDTGGFAPYGRALDLAPGTYHALGATSCDDWGVRLVYYKFL
ncbi:Uncharacterised protein [Slackia heliotrinireducens]|uniref:Uncharacterized protein n=1 Tax=Slackia heliotrinireducens (strain ATCC 29202 / DSM 20476 / NCTC 11029 / RHS 1) TaxID=471855 RepID=C7N0M4_SLAHD|nr:hypothetical protein [Slackia heliotrinireducens]ACV21102.1 hypothetical protein Shel_00270 [Slackia heliotrinireducens DSM 20476]VEH03602.1 Uncharacterised protein [Slackia heliotrinireducens]